MLLRLGLEARHRAADRDAGHGGRGRDLDRLAFVPVPAVAVLPPPPELAMPNAAAKAAITAMSPKAIVRGSMVLWLYFLASRLSFIYLYRASVGFGKARSG